MPAVSPDGERLAFRSIQEQNRDIWLMELDSSIRTRMSFEPVVDGEPVWHPNGSAVAWRDRAVWIDQGLASGVRRRPEGYRSRFTCLSKIPVA